MTTSPAKARPEDKEVRINEADGVRPGSATISENTGNLDGIEDAWLCLMEEDTLFNMQVWEVVGNRSGNKRKHL